MKILDELQFRATTRRHTWKNVFESMLPAGEEVEILIVDDGSTKDRTPQIADAYAAPLSDDHPGGSSGKRRPRRGRQCRICATRAGRYYKVVDSDDWVNTKSLTPDRG